MKKIPINISSFEPSIRERLITSKEALFNQSPQSKRFLNVLRVYFPLLKTARVIYWIPEQGEDIYYVLIDNHSVISVEFDRLNDDVEPIIEWIKSVDEYVRDKSEYNQLVLSVALELAEQDLAKK